MLKYKTHILIDITTQPMKILSEPMWLWQLSTVKASPINKPLIGLNYISDSWDIKYLLQAGQMLL